MILVSREKCGCVASALLCDYDVPSEIARFTKREQQQGHIVNWENRETIYAERCKVHEEVYQLLKKK